MWKPVLAGLFVLAACAETGQGSFVTHTGARVLPVNEDVFEVVVRPVNERNQFWCGAGEYAHRALNAPSGATIYVVGGAGDAVTMESPNGAQFSLKPASQVTGATGRDTRWGPRLGQTMFVSEARGRCRKDPFELPI